MWNILSIGNNNLRNAAFFPLADFGLLAFGINFFIDGGPKRWQAYTAAKQAEKKPMTAAARSSPFFLDDFVIPKNAGSLEKKAFFIVNQDNPASFLLGYVSLNPDSRFIGDLNPGHLVHNPIEFPTQIYAAYALPQNDAAYDSQANYEPELKPAIPYRVHQTGTKPYAFPLLKPEEFSMPKSTYEQSNLAPNYDIPKHAIEVSSNNFWQTSSYFLGIYSPRHAIESSSYNFWKSSSFFIGNFKHEKLLPGYVGNKPSKSTTDRTYLGTKLQENNFESQKSSRKTLDFIVEKIQYTRQPSVRMIYFLDVGIPAIPRQSTRTTGISSITQAAFACLVQSRTTYNETEPNYDTKQEFVDMGNSDFWKTTSYYKGEYSAEKLEILKNPIKEHNSGKPPYKKNRKNNEGRENKKPEKRKSKFFAGQQKNGIQKNKSRSSATYKLNSSRREKSYTGKQSAYATALINGFYPFTRLSYLGNRIKSTIFGIIANYHFKKEHSAFITDYENWRNKAEKELGVKIHSFFIDIPKNLSYGRNGNTEVPSASLNKIGISNTLISMLQEGCIDIGKGVPNIPELVLDRETKKHKEFSKDGNNSHKLTDLNILMEKFSCNGATNHILYALGLEGDYKENPTLAEIKKQIDRGMQKVMEYAARKNIRLKMEAPYIDEPKLKALGYAKNWGSNTTTAKDISLLMASTRTDDHLTEKYKRMWVEPLEQEDTMQWFKAILGEETAPIKPGIDKYNNGFVIYLRDKILTIILDKHPNPIYDNPDNKSEVHNRATQQGKKTFNYLAEFATILHNHWVNPEQKKEYKPIFRTTQSQPAHRPYSHYHLS